MITLTALNTLILDRFEVSRVLLIAPLRVARDTWPAEIEKWDHLKGLTYSVAVGNAAERRAALRQRTFIHIINRENVQWLIEDSGLPFDYDMVMGVLTTADMTAFAGYCQAYARWKEAELFIFQHGSIFQTPSGYVQQVPQVSISQQNLKFMQSFCSEFGLTPATRSRIIANGGGKDAEENDPMEALMKGDW